VYASARCYPRQMLVAELSDTSARVAETSGRKAKVELLAGCLLVADRHERGLVALYLSGSVRQPRLFVGYKLLHGLRDVSPAEEPTLSVSELDAQLASLAQLEGKGSAAQRGALLRALLGRATAREQAFLVRLMLGELRQGALESLLLEALARAAQLPAPALRRAQMLASDLLRVTETAFEQGAEGLARIELALFRPLQPMLAEPAKDVREALAQLGRAAFEYKLDGARVQVHKRADEVRVYSRALNEVSAAVPELLELVRGFAARELVLDGEVIALRADGTPLPFQETMRRFGRRLDVERLRAELPLSSHFFDCLYIDGESLLDAPAQRRSEQLERAVPEAQRMKRLVTADASEAQAFFERALAEGHEGLMAKALDAPYFAGSRGGSWLKLKQAHTLDLVVLAAEWGSGRRRGFLSNLHLGARDAESGGFVMLGKTFKGLSDELLRFQTEALLARETRRDEYTVYVRPELVVEIAFNEVQRSPHYPGGLALRFARVKRYRPDKLADQADTIAQVRAIHRAAAGS
jgi:DNA ligase 1